MAHLYLVKDIFRRPVRPVILFAVLLLVSSCASIDPNKVEIELEETVPVVKKTIFSDPLDTFGLMTDIYDVDALRIMSQPVHDNTGASAPTGGEIPRDMTEMIKSSLNAIGGRVVYIPYDPDFILYTVNTGYSNFDNKVIPDVVLSGGITEFDRALEVRQTNSDFDVEKEFSSVPGFFPGDEIGVDYGGIGKTGLARITLDFNLLDFKKMTGIPKMNSVNSMEVGKAIRGKELGVSIFGVSFGRKGTFRKVQGRHDAVRLLVQFSMIQILGKFYGLPYWRVLGNDAGPDRDVLVTARRHYDAMNESERIARVQEWLFLHGYDVPIDGVLDQRTANGLYDFDKGSYNTGDDIVNFDTFFNLMSSIPLNMDTVARRRKMIAMVNQEKRGEVIPAVVDKVVDIASDTETHTYVEKQEPSAEPAINEEPTEDAAGPSGKSGSFGRIITEDEWDESP